MDDFSVINNRKRAIIALIHSVFFLVIAAIQTIASHTPAFSLHGERTISGIVLLAIYTIVTGVLLVLLWFSGCTKEKLYFAFCAASAGFGLLRILLGDPAFHAGIIRVLMLSCAVLTGTLILRKHSSAQLAVETESQQS